MAYSVDLRVRVIDYIDNGHSVPETANIFQVSINTVRNWLRLKDETGDVFCRAYTGGAKLKVSQDEFENYVNSHPNQTLKEMGEHFGLSHVWAADNLKRYGYVNKKKA